MARVNRLEMHLAEILFCEKGVQLTLSKPNEPFYWMWHRPPIGLPEDIAQFIREECECSMCGADVSAHLSTCSCGLIEDEWVHLQVVFPRDLYHAKFKKVIDLESKRVYAMERKARAAENGGAYSSADIAALFELQNGMCWFCGSLISRQTGASRYHIDHYAPLVYLGTNDISNLVLTCPTCNLKKGAEHGDEFEKKCRTTRSPEVSEKLRRIRKKVRQFVRAVSSKS